MARIGLVGFFGWGNYGDELFHRVWENSIGTFHQTSVVHDQLHAPYFSRPATEIVKEFDALVIGGGDLVIPNKISPLYWNRAWLQRPIYIAGIGVPTWVKHQAPDVMERLQNFFQHPNVRYISTRDVESAQWIRRHLEPKIPVQVHADLVFSLDLPPAARYERPTVGINLRSHRKDSDPSQLLHTCRTLQERGYDIANLVLGTGRTGAVDLDVARSFPLEEQKVLASENIDELTSAIGGLDFLISNKFHGTVVAAAYGVSSVVLSSTTKSINLYRALDRKYLLSNSNDEHMMSKVDLAPVPVPEIAIRQLRQDAREGVDEVLQMINTDFPAAPITPVASSASVEAVEPTQTADQAEGSRPAEANR